MHRLHMYQVILYTTVKMVLQKANIESKGKH